MPKCNLLDSHICVVLPGFYKPCCQYTKPDGYADVLVSEMTHTEYVNTPRFQKIKEDMKTGWNKGCKKCQVDEKNNKLKSLRQTSNEWIDDSGKIQFLEISLSNYCNLSCKMCNPWSSSKWENYFNENLTLEEYFPNKKALPIDPTQFFKDVDLTHLTKIKYLGGEPFITPETKSLFNYLEENNIIQNVELMTNTNCTFFPEKWIKQLLKFKQVGVGLSVDGFDKSCEYSRTGSNWKILEENILKWKKLANKYKNIDVYFSTTINAFTVHDYHRLKHLATELEIESNPYVMHSPEHLRLEALPTEYVEYIKNSSNKQFLDNVKFNPVLFEKLKQFVKTTDKIQNIDINNYIPELAKYLT